MSALNEAERFAKAFDLMWDHLSEKDPGRLARSGWVALRQARDGFMDALESEKALLGDPSADAMGQHHSRARAAETKAAWNIRPKSGTQRSLCLDEIAASGDKGLTDSELAEITSLYRYSAAPRRYELMAGGWVTDSGRVRPNDMGNDETVWVLSPLGRSRMSECT